MKGLKKNARCAQLCGVYVMSNKGNKREINCISETLTEGVGPERPSGALGLTRP